MAAEDVELATENHDFDLLGFLGAQGKDHEFKEGDAESSSTARA
jgi:hypothetical protein